MHFVSFATEIDVRAVHPIVFLDGIHVPRTQRERRGPGGARILLDLDRRRADLGSRTARRTPRAARRVQARSVRGPSRRHFSTMVSSSSSAATPPSRSRSMSSSRRVAKRATFARASPPARHRRAWQPRRADPGARIARELRAHGRSGRADLRGLRDLRRTECRTPPRPSSNTRAIPNSTSRASTSERNAPRRYESQTLTLGGQLVRNDLSARLIGEGSECKLHGLFVGTEDRHIDNYTTVDHVAPHTTSDELYKGALTDQSAESFAVA